TPFIEKYFHTILLCKVQQSAVQNAARHCVNALTVFSVRLCSNFSVHAVHGAMCHGDSYFSDGIFNAYTAQCFPPTVAEGKVDTSSCRNIHFSHIRSAFI